MIVVVVVVAAAAAVDAVEDAAFLLA